MSRHYPPASDVDLQRLAAIVPHNPNPTEDAIIMSTIRAKFVCHEKANRVSPYHYKNADGTPMPNPPTCAVKLLAVSGDGNKEWSAATPSGLIEMTISNPDAYDRFELGKSYFVDFTPEA